MPAKGPLTLPSFIKASTPDGLRRQMAKEQNRRGIGIDWLNIQFANGTWYAWYYKEEPRFAKREEKNDLSSK
jgi:hypothetical protein